MLRYVLRKPAKVNAQKHANVYVQKPTKLNAQKHGNVYIQKNC
jgi:hypothetical protein